MADPRFYKSLPPASLRELSDLTGAVLVRGDADRMITGVAGIGEADADELSFCAGRSGEAGLAMTRAGACLAPEPQAGMAPDGCAVLVTPLPQAALSAAAARLVRPRHFTPGAPAIDPTARLEDGVTLLPGCVVGPDVEIGRGTVIGPGAVIGAGVCIGRGGHIGPRTVVGFALLGDRVTLHAGAVIGEPGFGAAPGPKGIVDLPQLGRVVLQDGVTIGANSCIDRGAFGDTVVGENTKIDNLVQIAHNVVIGRNCVLAAHTGISGSCVIGDGCMLGGRVGLADHVTVGPGARIAAASGVMHNIPAGESWGGIPARPALRWMRETAWLASRAGRRSGGDRTS
jgi:UDP-3-O-[3-hydroxymyristoyl] glucosamine N-acyltransferase